MLCACYVVLHDCVCAWVREVLNGGRSAQAHLWYWSTQCVCVLVLSSGKFANHNPVTIPASDRR